MIMNIHYDDNVMSIVIYASLHDTFAGQKHMTCFVSEMLSIMNLGL